MFILKLSCIQIVFYLHIFVLIQVSVFLFWNAWRIMIVLTSNTVSSAIIRVVIPVLNGHVVLMPMEHQSIIGNIQFFFKTQLNI